MRSKGILAVAGWVALGGAVAQAQSRAVEPVDDVNVLVGTAGEGQTFPSVAMPFAMTQWTPQTREGETKCVAPYYASDTRIQGFRGSHFLSGSCAQDYGSVTLMPMLSADRLDAAGRASTFSRGTQPGDEQGSPYRYAVELKASGIRAEITGAERTGMMRFRYPQKSTQGWLAVEDNIRLGVGRIEIDVARQEITGWNPVHRIYAGAGESAGFAGYFVIQFDRPFTVGGTWTEQATQVQRHKGAVTQQGSAAPAGAYVAFSWKDKAQDAVVTARIGTSFVSIEEARRNLAAEMPDFDLAAAEARARAAWTAALGKVAVAGVSSDRRIFYTAMYHAMQLPRIYSDRSGSYPRFASAATAMGAPTPVVERAQGFTYYDDYSVWDTFRALHPMLTLLAPERDGEMVRSLVAKGEQGGFLPIFPAWNSYTTEMTGDHVDAIIADAYVKGIRGFDAEAAYRLMRRNAMERPANEALYIGGRGRRALDSYLKYGYLPLEDHVPFAFHPDEQVSRTLDYAFDDYEVATMARALGHADDAALFARRAQNYRNVIDPAVGFARGRHADGTWVTPFDPLAKASYITEATPFIDTFFVPQDVPGLIALLHGPEAFVARLDELFRSGAYDHGNEPSHHIAYLYDEAGAAYKTQLHVHEILSTLYKDTPDGLAGNDDAGQMSAWYVMSALGIYAVTPGSGRYAIGTPRFDDVRVHLAGGRQLHIVARGAEAGRFYVQAIRLNGRLLDRFYMLHSELSGGGELVFTMSDQPATER